jgi:hypothetical protein
MTQLRIRLLVTLLASLMLAVAKKNDAKTHTTHALNSEGKIARKGEQA